MVRGRSSATQSSLSHLQGFFTMKLDRMRLSFNTGNMTGSIADKLAAIHEAGFGGTTMWPADFFVHFEDLDANLDHARTSPLACTCYMMVRDLEGSPLEIKARKLELARQMMDQMALIGAKTLVQCSNIGQEVDRNWSLAVEDLRKLGDLAKSKDMRIAFEPMSQGEWINTWQLGWRMVKDVDHDQIGLVLDASHIFLAGADLDGIEKIPGEKIFLCEVSDFPGANLDRREMLRNYRLFPLEGSQPIRPLVERVMDTGYQGPFSAEVFSARYRAADPRFVAKRGFEAVQKLFAKELVG
jgi:4-hydroxyphenylpyruvate dioxygenase